MRRRALASALCALVLASITLAQPPARPPVVTLQKERITLDEALRAFKDQTALDIERATDLDGTLPLKLNLSAVPFWNALDHIADQAGARLYLFRSDGKIGLVKRTMDTKLLASHAGLFRVALRRLASTSDLESGMRSTTATFEVAWDPRFLPVYMETKPRNLILRDSNNAPVQVPAAGSLWSSVEKGMAWAIDVPLPSLPRRDPHIGLLRGEFVVRGVARMLTFQFGGLEQLRDAKLPAEKRDSGVTCAVTALKLSRTRWTIQVATKLPPGGPVFESFQSWDVINEIYLIRKDGTRLLPVSYDRETAGTERAVVNYHFEDSPRQPRGNPSDWSLVYRAPAAIVEYPIPFEFKDIPLP